MAIAIKFRYGCLRALTLGVILVMVIILVAMLIDARGRSFRSGD
jgi:Na+/proline symporter